MAATESTPTFALGQLVNVEGEEGEFTIVKVMKSSAKVEKDGVTRIKPFALLTPKGGDSEPSAKPSRKLSDNPKSTKSRKREKASEPKSRKREKADKGTKGKKSTGYTMPQDEQEATLGDGTNTPVDDAQPTEKKTYPRSRDDKVAKELAKADSPAKLIAAIKKHSAYASINRDAFKRLCDQKDLQFGLFRMRAGNLLRGAIARKGK